LDNIGDSLVKVKELGLYYLSGSVNEDDQETLAEQVGLLTEEIMGLANTQIGNDYIFSGYNVNTRPFQFDGSGDVIYQGDSQAKELEIAPGERLAVTVPGDKVFQGPGAPEPELFATLQSLKDEMENFDLDEVSDKLNDLDEVMSRVSNERGRVGATMNRLESSLEIRQQATTDLKELLSTYEDADIVEASTKLIQQETSLKAALSVTSRISRISILDYM
jgi:flagellar hook-associated protein 3 FlgL